MSIVNYTGFSLACLMFPFILFSQTPPAKEKRGVSTLEIATGLLQQKEQILSRHVHRGYSIGLEYGKLKIDDHVKHFQLSLSYGRMKSNYEGFAGSINLGLSGRYNYGFEVFSSDRWKAWTGPFLGIAYDLSYYPVWDDSHFYRANRLEVGSYSFLQYKLKNDNDLVFDLQAPLLAILSRPPAERLYKIDNLGFGGIMDDFHNNLAFGSVNTVFLVEVGLKYRYNLGKSKQQAIGYHLEYARMKGKEGRPINRASNQLTLTFYL